MGALEILKKDGKIYSFNKWSKEATTTRCDAR